ncbi:MAG: hypothetical protein IT561_12135 [Alphaproteobacteria bacterium]|nr:hypothetical protein [Alphaproteobacteria bacterium]
MPQRLSLAVLAAFLLAVPAAAQDGFPAVSIGPALSGEKGASDASGGVAGATTKDVRFPPPEYSENLIAAYRRALDTRLPMVVAFVPAWSGFSKKLIDEVLLAPTFRERFEGRAIFVGADPDREDAGGNVGKLIRELKIERYPVVAILDPRSTAIRERTRIEGYFPLAAFTGQLDRALAMAPSATELRAR